MSNRDDDSPPPLASVAQTLNSSESAAESGPGPAASSLHPSHQPATLPALPQPLQPRPFHMQMLQIQRPMMVVPSQALPHPHRSHPPPHQQQQHQVFNMNGVHVQMPFQMHQQHPQMQFQQVFAINPHTGQPMQAHFVHMQHPHQLQPLQARPQTVVAPKACYCGGAKQSDPLRPSLQCKSCHVFYHHECIEAFKKWHTPRFLGDDFYIYLCAPCSPTHTESLQRTPFILADIAHIALLQMTHRPPGSIIWSRETPHTPPTPQMGPTDDRPYFSRKQLATFVDANWERFWLKPRATTWQQSLMSALIGGGGGNSNTVVGVAELRYLTGREQFPGDNAAQSLISLFHRDKLPSAIEAKRNRAPAYDIATNGCLMELGATAPPPPRVFSSTSAPPAPGGGAKKKESAPKRLLEISGGPSAGGGESDNESAGSRKRGGSVTPELRGNTDPTKKPANGGSRSVYRPRPQPRVLEAEEVDPNNSVLLYPDLNNPPNGPVTLSFEVTNTAPQMRVSANGLSVFTEKGYRMSKATHGVYEGCWYYELSFHPEEKGHARVGWSQISGDLQAPCGYDQFSYSYRDSPGTLFHQSMHVKGPEAYADGFKEGDVLGIMITLPTPTDMDNLVRRLWRLDSSYVQFRTKLMEKLPGSEIRYFKNGVDLGVAFTDLYQGKYYPAVSSYMSGTVTLNFGPTFKHALPNGARAYSDVPKVLAWADLALYSYEPFYVADREPARSAPAIATLGVHLGASPKRRERDFSYNGGGSFGARRTGTKKKKRSLVKKSAIVSAAAVAAGTGDVEVSNDVSVAVTVPLAQEGDEKAVSGELAEDMDEDDAGELEDGEGDSDAESHETPMSDAGEKEIVGGVDATLSL